MERLFRRLADVSHLLHDVPTDTASLSTPRTTSGGTGDELRYPLPYSMKEYTRLHVPKIDSRRFGIMQTEEALTRRAGYEE